MNTLEQVRDDSLDASPRGCEPHVGATARTIQVLICHGSPLVRAGLMAMLAPHADLRCSLGEDRPGGRGANATPDVVVADHSRGIEWVRFAGRPARLHAPPQVLVVTDSDRECDIRAALSAGVQGYLLIDDSPELLVTAIHSVRPGQRVLSAKVASKLAENVAAEALTRREQAVLGLVIEGLCNKSIANRLGITSGTVKSHLRSAFGKLGATSRTQAIAIAHRRGLLQQAAPPAAAHESLLAAQANSAWRVSGRGEAPGRVTQ
ncbi:MAG TPA: response regulator transcription factor [Ideonella sp.]|uniref:response regulator transcription factor n=1 Tax=Ideonella sp. TaxID=1929293 RepID=UPI002B8031E9|nr:response regulator transcription factor [Ideonella sp.]HSI49426.1 response regulator transcription factor [Ideonella sp.]